LYDVFLYVVKNYGSPGDWVLDPFAGTGGIHYLDQFGFPTVGVEIEPEWCNHPRTVQGDATNLPFADETFPFVITSPCFGNRMADHHDAQDGSYRRTYKHSLGRDLSPANTGALPWGQAYRVIHAVAWYEVWRVTRPGGVFVLDSKDHIRDHRRQHVTNWHYQVITGLGFELAEVIRPQVKGFRMGENRDNPGTQPFRLPERALIFLKPE
jgi:tRNA G10  N-methylase Trm11